MNKNNKPDNRKAHTPWRLIPRHMKWPPMNCTTSRFHMNQTHLKCSLATICSILTFFCTGVLICANTAAKNLFLCHWLNRNAYIHTQETKLISTKAVQKLKPLHCLQYMCCMLDTLQAFRPHNIWIHTPLYRETERKWHIHSDSEIWIKI